MLDTKHEGANKRPDSLKIPCGNCRILKWLWKVWDMFCKGLKRESRSPKCLELISDELSMMSPSTTHWALHKGHNLKSGQSLYTNTAKDKGVYIYKWPYRKGRLIANKVMVTWDFCFLFWQLTTEIHISHVKMGDSLLGQSAKQFEECCSIL